MTRVFNPPPNWPQPPTGWTPPPGWAPDPSWGPVPSGWQMWIHESEKDAADVRVFISYRRSDAQAQANGLYDGLSHRLPDAKIFMDIDSIPVGADFEHYIRREIEVCDIVLVLIGDDWLSERPGSEVRRIDEPGDFVRLEIESAFASPRVRVVPVLIEDATMPALSQLPPSLGRLCRINAIELSDKRWKSDLERLAQFLRGVVAEEQAEAERDYAPRTPPPVAPVQTRAAAPVQAPTAATETSSFAPYVPPPPPQPPTTSDSGNRGWKSERAGWIVALSPVFCCGLVTFLPFVRAALLRPHDRAGIVRIAVWGASLQVGTIVGYVLVGVGPEDENGVTTGVISNLAVLLLLVCILVAAVWGAFYRKAPQPE